MSGKTSKSSGDIKTQPELVLRSEGKDSPSIDRVSLLSDDNLSKNKVINLILIELDNVREEKTLVYNIDINTVEEVITELDRLVENRSLRYAVHLQYKGLD